jgi:hypothetical protein
VIQEKLSERLRASAFSHSETLLMLAFVLGGVLGLIPFAGPVGAAIVTAGMAAGAARVGWWAWQLRAQPLRGVSPAAVPETEEQTTVRLAPPPSAHARAPAPAPTPSERTQPMPGARQPVPDDEPTEPLAPPGYHLYRPGRRTPPEEPSA